MHVIRFWRVHLNLVAYGHYHVQQRRLQTNSHAVIIYFFECVCPLLLSFVLCLRIGNQVAVYRTWWNGSFGVIHRGEPLCCRLRRCKSERTGADIGKRISEERESARKRMRVTKVRARERTYRAVYHRIVAIGEERWDPLALLAYRYFGTRVRLRLTTAQWKGSRHPRRSTLSTSSSLSSFRRPRQKATNRADSERKECSRRLNWLGNGWFIARFSTTDPPKRHSTRSRERREKARCERFTATAFSHAREWIMYLYPADSVWSCKCIETKSGEGTVHLDLDIQYYLSVCDYGMFNPP